MHTLIDQNIETIQSICRAYHIKELYLFGSMARVEEGPVGDIDFPVVFDKTVGSAVQEMKHRLNLQNESGKLLNRNIDLVQPETLQNRYLGYFINKEKELVYAKA